MPTEEERVRITRLPCWRSRPEVSPLTGGMTNRNFLVQDVAGRHVVRLGHDVPHHGIFRWHELAVSRAAHAVGLSPEIEYAEPGVLVMRYIEGRTLTPDDVRDPARFGSIADLLRRCHTELPHHLSGPRLRFCPFQAVRNYATPLRAANSPWSGRLDELEALNERLERDITSTAVAFGHNDLLAGNLMEDHGRLWLIDWDYAAESSPLFDLANLATNNLIPSGAATALLEAYFQSPVEPAVIRDFRALRVASLLRESLWAMMSELHPAVPFDYAAYTRETLERLDAEMTRYDAGD